MNFDFKIIILGESFVGKTNIISRYIDSDYFNQNEECTIGIEFKKKVYKYQNKDIDILFWDTAGQERFKGITKAYYKENSGIILVYDISNEDTFKKLEYWRKEIHENRSQNSIILLLGNKKDLPRKVEKKVAKEYAEKNNYFFKEVSAKDKPESINKAFDMIIKQILRTHITKNKIDKFITETTLKNTKLSKNNPNEEDNSCC